MPVRASMPHAPSKALNQTPATSQKAPSASSQSVANRLNKMASQSNTKAAQKAANLQ